MRKLNIAFLTGASLLVFGTLAHAEDRSFKFINNGDRTVVEVHATSTGYTGWGGDLLGDYVVRPGWNIELEPRWQRGCNYDVMVKFDDNSEQDIWNVNLCTLNYLITDGYGRGGFTHRIG
jgi:hypothetical protein